ncbi:hypothetical protein JJB11_21155 [Ramlibacter ginsenosidimutans]|uniref:Clp protease ClpP n=1 Tax=Ramlibacter ginsenosidimutans TaxID=502333 RepID=A0A934TW98_9BURK|nr:hypothetical protein [Ramlibacter ginsenosidimutans]MBK6008618.1 hypothetical protein [Ramlibacter ginsenosidimutans]
MRRLLSLAMLLAAIAGTPVARAMEFHRVDDVLVMSGPVDDGDLVRLRDALARGPRPALVLLDDSPGGDLWVGYQLANVIRQQGLPTAVSGKCESACGLVFLGGSPRAFSDGRDIARTMVGLHGAHAIGSFRPLPELGPRMAWVIKTSTDRKYPADLLERTVYPRHAEDMVYAFFPGRYPASAKARGVVECKKQPDAKFQCDMLDGLDALGIGIVTTAELLRLPEDVKDLLEELEPAPAASQ